MWLYKVTMSNSPPAQVMALASDAKEADRIVRKWWSDRKYDTEVWPVNFELVAIDAPYPPKGVMTLVVANE